MMRWISWFAMNLSLIHIFAQAERRSSPVAAQEVEPDHDRRLERQEGQRITTAVHQARQQRREHHGQRHQEAHVSGRGQVERYIACLLYTSAQPRSIADAQCKVHELTEQKCTPSRTRKKQIPRDIRTDHDERAPLGDR